MARLAADATKTELEDAAAKVGVEGLGDYWPQRSVSFGESVVPEGLEPLAVIGDDLVERRGAGLAGSVDLGAR